MERVLANLDLNCHGIKAAYPLYSNPTIDLLKDRICPKSKFIVSPRVDHSISGLPSNFKFEVSINYYEPTPDMPLQTTSINGRQNTTIHLENIIERIANKTMCLNNTSRGTNAEITRDTLDLYQLYTLARKSLSETDIKKQLSELYGRSITTHHGRKKALEEVSLLVVTRANSNFSFRDKFSDTKTLSDTMNNQIIAMQERQTIQLLQKIDVNEAISVGIEFAEQQKHDLSKIATHLRQHFVGMSK